jgi:RNA polymerase sigma factor (sigma-70 family)
MLLEQAMLELPAEDRELITLRHLDGLSYQELAERLGVMYRLSR